MIRTRCNQITARGQCTVVFRSRVLHDKCRVHYILSTGNSRPIVSREKSDNKYRRTRSRRKHQTIKAVPKVIQNRNKRDKNANG